MSLHQTLDRFPRTPLIEAATPIQRLARVEAELGERLRGVKLYAKRDDHMALGGGGNKLRKLEYLVGEALAQGADTLVSTGGTQSNFTRLVAAAAAAHGLACELVLAPLVPEAGAEYEWNGNVLLDDLFGATIHQLPPGENAAAFADARVEALTGEGRKPYRMPPGGSSPLSVLGYIRCLLELDDQLTAAGIQDPAIVVPNGSAGTQAGLAAGLHATGRSPRRVQGFSVLAEAHAARATTLAMADAALDLLGVASKLVPDDIVVSDDQLGGGYGLVTPPLVEAVRLMAGREGVLLDPVYSGKAFAGLLADLAAGRHAPGSTVVFLVTGGAPGLFAYRRAFERGGEPA